MPEVWQEFPYNPEERLRFFAPEGELREEWFATYRGILFDEDDRKRAVTQGTEGYRQQYFEWRAAIEIFMRFDYVSLREWRAREYVHKQWIVRRFVSDRVWQILLHSPTEPPDLFVYRPLDPDDWFFCEVKGKVKGPGDRLSPAQIAHFGTIEAETGKDVRVVRLLPGI